MPGTVRAARTGTRPERTLARLQLRPGGDPSGLVTTAVAASARPRVLHGAGTRQVTLIDLLDRLLQGGIAIQGEITLAAADIDLVALDLRILVAAVNKLASR